MLPLLLVFLCLYCIVSGQVVPIPGTYDSCDSLSGWTQSQCDGTTISVRNSCDLWDLTWTGRTCIFIGDTSASCHDDDRSSTLQKDFDVTGYWNLSLELEVNLQIDYVGGRADLYVICQSLNTRIKKFIPRELRGTSHGWDFPAYKLSLQTFTLCEDNIVTLLFDVLIGESFFANSINGFLWDNIQLYGTPITPAPTVSPTPLPTAIPSTIPTFHPSPSPNLHPTSAPTISPTFPANIECQEIFVSNFSGSLDGNETFKVVDFVGINNHLYWELNRSAVVYRMYYDNQWKMIVEDEEYNYVRNGNLTTIDEAAGFPPLNLLSTWVAGSDSGKSITLRLSCSRSVSGTVDDTAGDILEWTTFIVVGVLLSLGILLAIIAFLFHLRKKGSDAPGYLSIIKFFIEIIDLYTDISFTYSVYLSGNPFIWYAAPAGIIAFAYLVSVLTALIKINVYKRSNESMMSHYMKSFDKAWLTVTLIVGYYATFNIFTSHLFHLDITSFQVPIKEKNNVKTLKIVNFVLLENLPMLILQTFYLLYTGYFDGTLIGDDISSDVRITLLAMAFGIIKIMSGVLTTISRCADCCCSKSTIKKEYFYLDIASQYITATHVHSHFLLSLAISRAIRMERSSIEVLSIVQKTEGIHCKISVDISDDHDMENYEALFAVLFKTSDTKKALKNEIKFELKMEDIKDVSVQRVKQQTKESQTDTKIAMEETLRNSNETKPSKLKSKEKKQSDGNKKKKKSKEKKKSVELKSSKPKKSDITNAKSNKKKDKKGSKSKSSKNKQKKKKEK